jgi:alpha-ketoglutarate-dependent taurine dioxygenase
MATANITLHPSGKALGAEVRGVDFTESIGADDVNRLKAAWAEHLVLVVPEQSITDEQHVALTRYFGEPEVFHQTILKSTRVREIFRVSNTDEDGNVMPPSHPTMLQLSSAKHWHTDSSYRTIPAMGSLLHGIEVAKTGGRTCFANMYEVYAALPSRLKAKVDGRRALHDFDHLSRVTGAPLATVEEREAMPPVWQPLVRRHPVTGAKSLYFSPIYNCAVEGLSVDAADELITELTAFTGQARFVYEHQWRNHDIVMWDNQCVLHYVTPHEPTERRIMHRTTIRGTEPVVAA